MTVLAVVAVAAIALAFANGANDNSKGVATLYGSGLASYRRALAWATLTTLLGSLAAVTIAGGLARRFSGRGLVPDAVAVDPAFLAAVALGAAATVLLATRFGVPISTTHALTGALVGAGLTLAGGTQVRWAALGSGFVLPLLLSPLAALVLAAAGDAGARRAGRWLGGMRQACVCAELQPVPAWAPAAARGGAAAQRTTLHVSVGALPECRSRGAHVLARLDVAVALERVHFLSAGAVGFARGVNDTPKIAALLLSVELLPAGAAGAAVALAMAAGGLLAARRVAEVMSFGITGLDHRLGLGANLVTAGLVSLASPLGLPVSTTHVSCGALFGIGAVSGRARGRTIAGILSAWVVTLPLAAALAAAGAFAVGAR